MARSFVSPLWAMFAAATSGSSRSWTFFSAPFRFFICMSASPCVGASTTVIARAATTTGR